MQVAAKHKPQEDEKGCGSKCTTTGLCMVALALLIVLLTICIIIAFTVGPKINVVANKAVVMSSDAQKVLSPVLDLAMNLTGTVQLLDPGLMNDTVSFINEAMKRLQGVNVTEAQEIAKRGLETALKAVQTFENLDVDGAANKLMRTFDRTMTKGFHVVLGDSGKVDDINDDGQSSSD